LLPAAASPLGGIEPELRAAGDYLELFEERVLGALGAQGG
jgi:hypothetical protein